MFILRPNSEVLPLFIMTVQETIRSFAKSASVLVTFFSSVSSTIMLLGWSVQSGGILTSLPVLGDDLDERGDLEHDDEDERD